MSSIAASTVRMANQIARNFEAIGHEAAIAATADHIEHFWDPRMKSAAFELLEDADAGFSPAASAALRQLACGDVPASQSRATQFNTVNQTGGSDAG